MIQRFAVKLVRYDEAGNAYHYHDEGDFELLEDTVVSVTGSLGDILEAGDSLQDVKRKLQPPYFRIERLS